MHDSPASHDKRIENNHRKEDTYSSSLLFVQVERLTGCLMLFKSSCAIVNVHLIARSGLVEYEASVAQSTRQAC